MNGFLNNTRQNGGLGMSNIVNAMRNTSRNRNQAGSGTTPNVPTSNAPVVPTNTVPKSPFISGSRRVPSTIPGSSVPSIDGNMSHYPVQNDSGRYGGLDQNDFMKKYNAGSLWNDPNTRHYPANTVPATGVYPTTGYVPTTDNNDNSDLAPDINYDGSDMAHKEYIDALNAARNDRTPESFNRLSAAAAAIGKTGSM